MSKKEKLSKKELGFVQDYSKTGNGTRSVMNNYDVKNENVAAVEANRMLRKPKIQKAIMSIAEQIPDKLLVEKHLELLMVPKIITKYKRDGTFDVEENTDVQALKAGLDMAYKLKGSYSAEKLDFKGTLSLSSLFEESKKTDDNE